MCNLLRISGCNADSVDRSMERIEKEIQQLREREKELRYADCYNVLHVDVINNTLWLNHRHGITMPNSN